MPTGVTIRAFGYISFLLGREDIVLLPCDTQVPVRSILAELSSRYPLFSNYVSQANAVEHGLLILRDGRTEGPDSMINPGEELILATPMSGG